MALLGQYRRCTKSHYLPQCVSKHALPYTFHANVKACSWTLELQTKQRQDWGEVKRDIPCSAIICARPWEDKGGIKELEGERVTENTWAKRTQSLQYFLVLWWYMFFPGGKAWHQNTQGVQSFLCLSRRLPQNKCHTFNPISTIAECALTCCMDLR